MLLAAKQVRIPGVFVVRAKRFDETDRRQRALAHVTQEDLFILKGRAGSGRRGIERPVRVEGRIFGIVPEGLMMVLKKRVGVAMDGVAPTAGVPLPAYSRIVEAIAYCWHVICLGWIDIIDRCHELG